MYDLSGKVVVVTGGRRGIGRAFVEALLNSQARVIVVAKSDNSNGLNCPYIQCDLSVAGQRSRLIDKIVHKHGAIDILVNNAGCQYYCPAASYSLSVWENSIAVMVTAALDLSQQAYPYMKAKEQGRIINISSLAAFQGSRNTIGYVVSKHALTGMTKCLSNEWSPFGITVNCIAPGFIETEMLEQLTSDKTRTQEMLNRIPVGRFGTPKDLTGALLFLCSDESSYMTGQSIIIDGGWRERG
jgi:2-deoxy-D-gluconate 3-dehydrogenase